MTKPSIRIASLPIESIRLDFQKDDLLDDEKVEEFAQRLRNGEKPDPVRVNFDGENYWLGDGFPPHCSRENSWMQDHRSGDRSRIIPRS